MNDSLPDNSFVPRGGLQRTIKYRPVLAWSFYFCLISAGFSLVAGFTYMGVQIAGEGFLNPLVLFAFLIVMPAAGFLLAWVGFRPYAFTTIKIRTDGFTKERPWDQSELLFANVRAVKLRHVPYFGGRFVLTDESGTSHHFTASLERSEYILEALQAARPDLLSEQKFLRFRRTAVTSDHSWARLNDRFKNQRKEMLLLFLGLPLAGFAVAWPYLGPVAGSVGQRVLEGLSLFFALFLLNFTLGLICFAGGESFLLNRGRRALRDRPNELRRDPELEARTGRWMAWAHLGGFCFFLGAVIAAFGPV